MGVVSKMVKICCWFLLLMHAAVLSQLTLTDKPNINVDERGNKRRNKEKEGDQNKKREDDCSWS